MGRQYGAVTVAWADKALLEPEWEEFRTGLIAIWSLFQLEQGNITGRDLVAIPPVGALLNA
ncbi:MAG: hypothetical protein KGI33_06530 [Thaumarchaeota archaeon]|nr:hypothetical protein [Nitrososphaerota archaeon]